MNILKSISSEQREKLKTIFDLQLGEYSSYSNYVKWHPATTYLNGEDLINSFKTDTINIIRDYSDREMMHIFAFSLKYVKEIYKILDISDRRFLDPRRYSATRVLANGVIPMHIDTNKNAIREQYTYTITLRGADSTVNFSDKKDGSKIFSFYGLVDWSFYPTRMPHGAVTCSETLDILQISME